MTTLLEFIETRRKQIESELETLSDELQKLNRLHIALQSEPSLGSIPMSDVNKGMYSSRNDADARFSPANSEHATPRGRTRPAQWASHGKHTIKEMAVAVLDELPSGATAGEIIDGVRKKFNVEVPRTSMSPQLSRLKSEGVIAWDGETRKWRLVQRDMWGQG